MMINTVTTKQFLFIALISLLPFSPVISAQDYARHYGTWEQYLGTWYGKDNTVVSLTRDGGEQMMICIRYNGREYNDGLFCFSPSYASAEYLTLKDSGTSANFTAGLSLSSGNLTLKIYPSGANYATFETTLSKSSSSLTRRQITENELIGTKRHGSSQSVTLTSQKDHVCVNKVGTVTFSGPGITLEEIAKEEGLSHISGRTYRAAVIYDALFEYGYFCDPRGKIYNCTDNTIYVTCAFYSGSRLIAKNRIEVKPRVFMRITGPEGGPRIEYCDKIVLSD